MALQTINIGATANDGTGDPPRTAGTKVNANFTALAAGNEFSLPAVPLTNTDPASKLYVVNQIAGVSGGGGGGDATLPGTYTGRTRLNSLALADELLVFSTAGALVGKTTLEDLQGYLLYNLQPLAAFPSGSWVAKAAAAANPKGMVISNDGQTITILNWSTAIRRSINGGASWVTINANAAPFQIVPRAAGLSSSNDRSKLFWAGMLATPDSTQVGMYTAYSSNGGLTHATQLQNPPGLVPSGTGFVAEGVISGDGSVLGVMATEYNTSTTKYYKSINAGASWSSTNLTSLVTPNTVNALRMSDDGSRVIAGYMNLSYEGQSGNGGGAPDFVQSVNGGTTWTSLPVLEGLVNGWGLSSDGLSIFASVYKHLVPPTGNFNYVSSDGGATWTQVIIGANLGLRGITHVPDMRRMIGIDTDTYTKVYSSTNRGASWSLLYTAASPLIATAMSPNGGKFAIVYENGTVNVLG